ncbi:MAG: DPP IV N-terminal domain-containing protein [Flavobacteriales bacterium]|jgi:dipeptidyl-peptidase-4|tara:strand:+ start:6804 stop:8918 length:2115 start_codon:yes stop_codon:yes gene_type:complete
MTRILLVTTTLLLSTISFSQNKSLTVEDAVMGYYNGLYPEKITGLQWVPGTELYSAINSNVLYVFDNTGKIKKKLTLAEIKTTLKNPELSYMPRLTWESPTEIHLTLKDKLYILDPFKNELKKFITLPDRFENIDFHFNSESIAYTQENDLFIWRDGQETRVTKNNEHNTSGQAIARYEFGISKGTFWSPSGAFLAFYEKNEENVTEYPLLDYSSTPASSHPIKYPMAGQLSEHGRVGIVDSETGETTYLQQMGEEDSYVTNIAWSPDNQFIYLAHLNREQTSMALNKYNRKGDFLKTIYQEFDEEYVEPENPPYFIPNGKGEFIWITEKNGFSNLVLMNDDGIIRELTNLTYEITDFIGFNSEGTKAFFHATGENPTENHGYAVELETGTVTQLTSGNGTHTISVSESGKFYIDNYSSTTIPGKTTLYHTTKSKSWEILSAENPLSEYSIGTTEIFSKKTSDGTELWCRMIKPSHFDETKKYPVLFYVYNGPHVQLVTDSWLGGASLWMHSLAEEGYIIFTVDGRGSSHRGIDFEQTVHENMGTIEVQDQAEMAEWLKTLPYTDNDRFAVHGWSYGGFMTTSLMLKKPGLFKVGVAGGPVIDWRLYEIMYTERYMDTPETNPEGYAEADLKTHVANLEGKLMLIHGASDDVVVMQHSMEFLTKCIEEGKEIEFFPYPGHAHNVRGKDRVHLMTKVLNYIKSIL